MKRFYKMPSIGSGRRLLSARTLGIAVPAIILGAFAFANAAAQYGVKLPPFQSFGPAFSNNKADLLRQEIEVAKEPAIAGGASFATLSIAMLHSSPLNARALRNYGLHREALGDTAGARKAFLASNAVSRRDGRAQYWLINDAARSGDERRALQHFDAILRVMPETTQPLIERLALATANPQARHEMTRFVRADNPWLTRYVEAAVKLPSMEPLAQLFVDAGRVPDVSALRTPYRQIVEGLVRDRKMTLLGRFYPLLPAARRGDLSTISVDERALQDGYPPVVWDLGESSDRGGALIQFEGKVALELFGLPDTRGMAARKLVIPPPGATRLMWTAVDQSRNDGSKAYWVLRCLDEDKAAQETRSVDLLSEGAPARSQMGMPRDCGAMLVQFEIDGGTGRDPARMVFSSISVG